MGCMSSKVISRSISLNYDLNLKRRKTDKANPLIDEIFGHNTVSQNFNSNPEIKTTSNEDFPAKNEDFAAKNEAFAAKNENFAAKNEWELGFTRVDPPKRSKSWHQFPKDDDHEDEEFPWQGNGVVRSRSFHTVEEYDALLEKMRLSRSLQDDDVDNEASGEEVEIIDVIEDESLVVEEKDCGNKRQMVAKRLDSLKIPTMIEFTAIGSLREWLQGGGKVYSPGTTYVTPKFGNYSSSNSKMNNESGGGNAFNPELVSAIEVHMQELEDEEETIIMQIADNWDGKIVSC